MALGSFGFLSIAHVVLFVLAIIELGLTGYDVSRYDDNWFSNSPSQFNFMLFNSVWTILVLIYIGIFPVVIPKAFSQVASFALTSLTALFWFAGSIAMAVFIGVPHCDGNNFCQSAQAGVAFGFFLWAGFTALAILEGIAFFRGRGGAHADVSAKRYNGA